MNKIKNWVPELQSLSGLAIIFVVLIHATAYYLLSVLNRSSFEEVDFITRLVDNFIHGAVPMFIFVAGYKYALNNINKPYKEYAIIRTNKVLKPFLIISMIFFIKDIIVNLESLNIRNSVISFFRIFIGYNIAYQLWYIPMYLFIALTYPILHKLIKNEKIRIIFIVGIVIIQYSLSWYSELLASHPFDFVYYYVFFHIGLIFCKYDIKSKLKKWDIKIIVTFVIVALIITLNPINELCGLLKRFILWPMSVIAYYFFTVRIKDNRLLQYLGKYSFYIFLLHEPIFCTKISYIFKSIGIYNSVIESFIIGVLTIGITILTYKIIEKTFIKKLLF
jgi:peptidoglycan/LPS O-acetylase OafA/YrhL